MPGFVYFLGGKAGEKKELTPPDLTALGLGHLADAGNPLCRGATGPEGKPGLLFGVGAGAKVAYKPDAQTWLKLPGAWVEGVQTEVWIGYWNEARPGPESLRRTRFLDGETVRLRDGQEWTIPIARSVVRSTTLPKEIVLGADCKTWETRELPEFLSFCGQAERAFALIAGTADADGVVTVELPYQECMEIVTAALAVNYRVSAVEVSMLRLFTDDEMELVLRAVCDVAALEQMLADRKKKEQTLES